MHSTWSWPRRLRRSRPSDPIRDSRQRNSMPTISGTRLSNAVRIIHEWVGETKGDQFSWIARSIGDVDGDRVSDVVTSAPSFGANGQPAGRGRVYVYSGKTARLVWQYTGDSAENVGTGLEGAGDVDRDGVNDVVAGAPGSGRAYVLSGRNGSVLHTLKGTAAERFGSSSAGAGDQDGDGHADVVVGAPGSNANGQGSGQRLRLFGEDRRPDREARWRTGRRRFRQHRRGPENGAGNSGARRRAVSRRDDSAAACTSSATYARPPAWSWIPTRPVRR